MTVTYDSTDDVLVVTLADRPWASSVFPTQTITVDLDDQGRPIAVEVVGCRALADGLIPACP